MKIVTRVFVILDGVTSSSQGNVNRFETSVDCQTACIGAIRKPKNAVCSEPLNRGKCRAIIPRFYFDTKSETCKTFNYGGCGGNDNNFGTKEECLETCEIILEPVAPTSAEPGLARTAAVPPVAVDTPQPPVLDVCSLPKEVGPCHGFKPSFYYDVDQKKCLRFNYGGCKGNGNRFETSEECQSVCIGAIRKPKNGVCYEPVEVGKCRASIRSFYFDTESETCKVFHYGGCGGNGNLFFKEEECLNTCEIILVPSNTTSAKLGTADLPAVAVETPPAAAGNVCSLSADAGPCRGFKKRYFFNATAGECQQFNYGGCRGNANNFLTLDECREGCVNKPTKEAAVTSRARSGTKSSVANPDCRLPADRGFCRANVTRFYYDRAEKSCKPFIFGGCFGNGNNFMTETECLASCAPQQLRAIERAQYGRVTLDLPVGPAPDECVFGNLTVKIGYSIATEDPCVNCTCHTPPVVSCTRQTCPPFPSKPNAICRAMEEPGRCCPSYECVPSDTLSVELCADHVCPEGTVCKVESNKFGPYADCVAQEPLSRDAGATRK